jgi:hypothetical protein
LLTQSWPLVVATVASGRVPWIRSIASMPSFRRSPSIHANTSGSVPGITAMP